MPSQRTVAVIVGSLRQASFTRRAAKALEALAPAHLAFTDIPIGALALYNEELEADVTPAWHRAGPLG